MSEKGFYSHIQEAININKVRKKQYSKLSGGKTSILSNVLIGSEMMTKPIARYYDKKAKPFNILGIMIVKEDFVDMDIPPYDTAVLRQSAWNQELSSKMKLIIRDFINSIPKNYTQNEHLNMVLKGGRICYQQIEELEEKHNLHCAMTKHMLESICFISKNGIVYSEQSDGATLSLSGSLIKQHKIALNNSLWMDKWGNKFHQQNIGILINDMPLIPIH